MALNPGLQFDETSLTSVEFDPQDKVLPNSPVQSNDVNAIASRALRRTAYLRSKVLAEKLLSYDNTFTSVYPAVINTFTTNSFVDSSVLLDIPNCVAGDRLRLQATGAWSLNGPSAGTVIGELQFAVVEDFGGAASLVIPEGYATIFEQVAGSNSAQHYSMYAMHEITTAGPARVKLRARKNDLSGGAGTATVVLFIIARIDVDHLVRS
jgi:hypothetical protein